MPTKAVVQGDAGFLSDGGLRGVLDLLEVRGRLYIAVFSLGFVMGYPLAEEVIEWLLNADGYVPEDVEIIILQPLEVVLLQLRIAAQLGFALMILAIVIDLSMRNHDRIKGVVERASGGARGFGLVMAIMASLGLGALGLAYAHNILVPFLLEYLAEDSTASGLQSTWQLQKWVGFVTGLYFSSVIGFQVPVVVVALLRANVIERGSIESNRSVLWFTALFIGALISPPDPISLFLVGGPMLVLLEAALIFDKASR